MQRASRPRRESGPTDKTATYRLGDDAAGNLSKGEKGFEYG